MCGLKWLRTGSGQFREHGNEPSVHIKLGITCQTAAYQGSYERRAENFVTELNFYPNIFAEGLRTTTNTYSDIRCPKPTARQQVASALSTALGVESS
jgi:hypothetical protein